MPELFASDRWREIDDLFQQALDLDPDRWPAFLDEHCADDDPLRQAVSRLLGADSRSGRFLDASAETVVPEAFVEALSRAPDGCVPDGASGNDPATPDRAGERVGAWRIVRCLGRGGMAGVYLAERADGGFEQTVAIKFIRRGLDTEDFVRRFVAERHILSSLHHPNIASLIGGGTTDDGLPYLVIEYVDGVPITEYCDERQCTIAERLRLFGDAARAVQYAHANLIVHRDIKPSNIMVTPDGHVKLLDFGIAKLLDPDADPAIAPLTRTGFRPLTPEYASPEQVRGEAITTASDVYQLGVLLYRLLTGERPYDVRGVGAALEEAITETRPTPPSTAAERLTGERAARRGATPARLGRRLRGDLDVIVLKALRKDPDRRYGSAVEMAEDVRRHLQGRPILARRESRTYRVGKFLRRNGWFAPAAVVVTLVVGVYIATLVRHGRQLEAERNVARDVQQAFVGFFTAPDSADGIGIGLGEGRRNLTVREAILEGADRVRDDLADRPAARAELFGAMAEVLADLDEQGRALQLAEEALEIEEALHGPVTPQVHETILLVGNITSDPDSARALLRRHLELSRALYGERHPAVATSLEHLGQLEHRAGNPEEAVRLFERAIDIHRKHRGADSIHARQLAWALGRLAESQLTLERPAAAVAAGREAYDIMHAAYGADHSETAIHGVKLAAALRLTGDVAEAGRLYEASLPTMDAEFGPTHTTTMHGRGNYALLLLQMDDYRAAETVQRRILEDSRQRYGEISLAVARSLQNLATNLKEQGRHAEADSLSSAAYATFLQTHGDTHYQTAFPLLTLAEIRLTRGDFAGAESVARDATRILRATLPAGHYATAVAECRWGRALAGQGDLAGARELLEPAAEVLVAVERANAADYREECLAALAAL